MNRSMKKSQDKKTIYVNNKHVYFVITWYTSAVFPEYIGYMQVTNINNIAKFTSRKENFWQITLLGNCCTRIILAYI